MVGIKKINEIDFRDMKVHVFYDQYTDKNTIQVISAMRNPESQYTGILYWNPEQNKYEHLKDAVIPVQTPEDREIIPKAIVVGVESLTDEMIEKIINKLEENFLEKI